MKVAIVFLKNIKKVYLITFFYLSSQLFTPEVIIAVGKNVLKITQACTGLKRLITNPNQSVGDKITVILFSVAFKIVFELLSS